MATDNILPFCASDTPSASRPLSAPLVAVALLAVVGEGAKLLMAREGQAI